MKKHLALPILLAGVVLQPSSTAMAYVTDSDKPAAAAGESAALRRLPAAPPRPASADQRAAAQIAEGFGVRTEWHPQLGTPASVRGPALGERRAYSRGPAAAAPARGNFGQAALGALDNLGRLYGLRDAASEFQVRRVDADKLGFHHVRLTQTHSGVKVFGGELIVHFNERDEVYEVNGSYVPELRLSVTPAVVAPAASNAARAHLAKTRSGAAQVVGEPALIVFAQATAPRLAYELTLAASDGGRGPARWRYWIDAQTGEVLLAYNDIKKIAAPTTNGAPATITGNILAGEGGQSITVTGWFENTGYYYLHNTNRHWTVYNVATAGWPDTNTWAHRATANWSTTDRAEVSLARNFDTVQQYYWEELGWNSFNGAGITALANAHEGVNYVNAYWNGAAFYFGDGDGVIANSLATLDISGHEYTHAVTDYTADLIYANEPGALNESFSDVMGACIEFYAQTDGRSLYPGKSPGTADWLCGEDCWLSSTALRDMRNPRNTATVGAGGEQPSRYKGTYWYTGAGDNGGVHYNSGVQNFFFYLLCEGGSGNNDGIIYNLTGIDVTNAQQIAFRALTVYCTANTDYRAVRSAWISAAQDLNPVWADRVAAAWAAVGIGALAITPDADVTSRGPVGGPFTPASLNYTLLNTGTTPMNWGVSSNQTWANLSPTSGTIAAGGSQVVTITMNSAANSLAMGIYTNSLTFTNNLDPGSQTRRVLLLVGQPDYFTELFDTSTNDLAFQTFTLTPDGSSSYYSLCRETAAAFPTDPTGGTTVTLSDDSYATVTVGSPNTVAIYNRRTNIFYIGSNGYLTMDAGDTSYSATFANHFNRPRVSACYNDLNPASGGTISWKQTTELVAVTFSSVRRYGSTATISFQIELFFDGRIRLTYLGVTVTDGLAGVSAGSGVPPVFTESDLSSYGPCAPPDGLAVAPDAGLISQGYEGGPFSPTDTNYFVSNVSTGAFNWSVSATQPWITINPTGGSLDAGAGTNVTVQLNASTLTLPAGTHTANVTFSNLNTGFTRSRTVTLQVLAIPGEIGVTDSIAPATDLLLPFGEVIVGLARTEHITITNSDAVHGLIISDISFGAYREDFNDGLAQDWVETTDAQWSVVSGEYRAQAGVTSLVMQSVYTGTRWQDCSAQVVMRRTGYASSAARILLRASDDFSGPSSVGSAYAFAISGDGSFYVGKYNSGVFTFLQSWTSTPLLNLGSATNTVLASVQGNALRIYLNGVLAWSGTDSSIPGQGRVGLLAYSGSTTETVHYFDNVVVADPVTSFAGVGPVQASLNRHPLPGGTAETTPPGAPPAPTGDPGSNGGEVEVASLTSGPFQLDNVPTLPLVIPPGGALTFDVVYEPTATGSNYAGVSIRSNDADEPDVLVQLTGLAIPDPLTVSPGTGLAAQGHPGGPFSPGSMDYTLSNSGPASLDWTMLHTQSWVNVAPASGSLAAGQATTVTVSFTAGANLLGEGVHADLVTFSNVTTTISKTRPVALTVYTSPMIVVAPPTMAVTNMLGGSTNVGLMVSNAAAADGQLTFRINTRETGHTPLPFAGAGVGLPPAGRDFTQIAPQAHEPGELLARFAAGVSPAQRTQLLGTLGGAQVLEEFSLVPGLCRVKLPAGQMLSQALRAFNQTPGILYAEPNYRVKAGATIPNDTRFSELWGMHNTGQTGGTSDADIDAPEAWDVNTGNRQIIVAVVDTGVDYTHPDLTNNSWTNLGEVAGNGVDDDGNGRVDDVHGYDFVNNDGNPMDDNGHGTHVSGTIGGEGNNSLGVAGVCWQVRIMGCKFLGSDGSGTTANAILAVQYATQNGANVMNNSWGGGAYSQALKDAIDAAGAANVVFVAAAGNASSNNDTTPQYPASYGSSNIVAVMATDHNDVRSTFSNYGQNSVHLAAPGTSILSCQPGGGYQLMSGTSMATPHVAGACALLLSANPSLTVAELKAMLLATVDPVVPGQCVSGGRLNVNRALAAVGAGWITVTPNGGTNVPPGSALSVNVGFLAGSLPAGVYSGELIITSNDRLQAVTNLPVTMTILPDDLRILPATPFASSGISGGPFTPAETLFTLSNAGPATLDWSLGNTQSWVSVSAASGTLPAGASLVVTGLINAAANLLSPGNYADSLAFSNLTSGVTQRRAVSLVVLSPSVYLRSSSGAPWGANGNEVAMNRVFGTNNWQDLRYQTVNAGALFSGATRFIFMEGGADNWGAMGTFLTNNLPAISNWVAAGGRLFLNAAPYFSGTSQGSLGFGVTLNIGDASATGTASNPGHPVFSGPFLPVGFAWSGSSFGHSTVSGAGLVTVITNNANGNHVLAEKAHGSGLILFGGMTTPNFHTPATEAANLRANILAYTANYAPCTNCPPVVIAQPQNRTVVVGGVATFSVSASGTAPLNYYWRRGGTPIAGATDATYATNNVQLTDSGSVFSCLVSNAYGSVISSNAVLTVVTGGVAVAVFDNPLYVDTIGTTDSESDNLQASITNRGFAVVTFTNIAEAAAGSPLLLFPEQENQALGPALTVGERSVLSNFVASGGLIIVHGSSSTRAAGLINTILGWTTVESTFTGSGSAHFLTAAATGTQFADDPANLPWNDACSSLLISSLPAGSRGIYTNGTQALVTIMYHGSGRVIFLGWDWWNAAPRGSQNGGWLTVLESAILERGGVVAQPPTIFAQPQNVTVTAGSAATFSVTAFGSAPLNYYWSRNGTPIVGATQSSYTTNNVQVADSGSLFSCLVSNALGTAPSSNALLTVVPGISLPEAVDAPQLVWATGGNANWFGQLTNRHDGVDAAQSGAIGHSQQTWLETTVTGPGTLTFWWMVSSESGFDYLRFYLDGALQGGGISGSVSWTQPTFTIPAGTHTLRWTYSKDGSVVVGWDAGWVDEVTFISSAGALHHFAWDTIGSPQYVNVPFPTTIAARDYADLPVTNFNGCVTLSVPTAQTNVVGTGTNTTTYPIYTFYHDERTQIIYQPGEIGGAGQITALALDVATLPGQIMNNWTIRMKHTPLASYTNYLWESTGWTVVYQANQSVTGTGWIQFPLSAPFNYNGVDNLMIDFSFNNSTYTTSGAVRSSPRSGVRVVYYYTDSGYGDPLTWSGSTPSPLTSSSTPNLRLVKSGGAPNVVLPALVCLTNGLWTGNLTVQNPGAALRLRADDGAEHIGESNPFNVLPSTSPLLDWSFGGQTLTLSWSGTGYRLQAQTNNATVGLSSNWFDYPGGGSSPVIIPFNPANPTVFFRLVSP